MSQKLNAAIAVIGIDIGKNSFHVVGHDKRGAIVLRQKWSRGQCRTSPRRTESRLLVAFLRQEPLVSKATFLAQALGRIWAAKHNVAVQRRTRSHLSICFCHRP